MIEIFTDGGCTGNPGPGGWAAVIQEGSDLVELSGGENETTNNRMELTAAIQALDFLAAKGCKDTLLIHTDSEYLKNGITSWIRQWKANGWKTAGRKDVKNRDLWEILDQRASTFTIRWQWVKAHSGIALNERCDRLVAEERARRGGAY